MVSRIFRLECCVLRDKLDECNLGEMESLIVQLEATSGVFVDRKLETKRKLPRELALDRNLFTDVLGEFLLFNHSRHDLPLAITSQLFG